ncbi:MAG: 50S ribosomal protein L17 [Chloroflexi bacterium]|nr:50S ribosomal protein L17 [Chloroflexota bacterium]
MRHRKAGYKLGRSRDARKWLRRNLLKQLFEHRRIRTTRAKAKAIQNEAEKIITLAKKGLAAAAQETEQGRAQMVHYQRLVAARLGNDRQLVHKIFHEIAPLYENRPGGYTRIYRLGWRKGDAAEMVLIELVEE